MRTIFSALFVLLLIGCNTSDDQPAENNGGDKTVDNKGGDSVVFTSDIIPRERKNVNPQPVVTYAETVTTFETTDKFKVSVYETKLTFRYRIRISYKQLDVEDTLKVPNFGIQPSIKIVKGDSIRPSCILGFFDKEKKFRESKLIYFKDNKLKIKVLKHYAVYQSDNE